MFLKGKKVLIMGLANERSIAYGIAKSLSQQGAELGFTYIDLVEKRVRPIAEEFKSQLVVKCDVSNDVDLKAMADAVNLHWNGEVDCLVHSVAFADKEDLEKDFVFTSRKGFHTALDISCYSLVGSVAALLPALEKSKGSVLTLSYFGAERVIPHYNVMGVAKAALEASVRYLAADLGPKGIRVNAISAGPIRTLAASGVKDFRSMLGTIEQKSPLRRNVTIEDVGDTALFLASNLSRGMTGEILYVDSGYNVMGM